MRNSDSSSVRSPCKRFLISSDKLAYSLDEFFRGRFLRRLVCLLNKRKKPSTYPWQSILVNGVHSSIVLWYAISSGAPKEIPVSRAVLTICPFGGIVFVFVI